MRRRLAQIAVAAGACATGALVVSAPVVAAGDGPTITAKPGLRPGFRVHITDYVNRCRPGEPVELAVGAPEGVKVGVDGAKARTGTFTARVALAAGQSADLVVHSADGRTRHHIRCLPPDFPGMSFRRWRRPAAQWYLLAPVGGVGTAEPRSNYLTFLDGRGVPVWWNRPNIIPFNTLFLENGQVASARWYGEPFGRDKGTGWVIHRLDGSLVRTLRTVDSPTDLHDMQLLPNGNHLLLTYRLRHGVDVRIFGGGESGSVWDGEIQEISKTGQVVWSWNSKDHMSLSENTNWRFTEHDLPGGKKGFDWFHLNSVEPDGDGYVISVRHLDAVFRIDRATGRVSWKLGGTQTAKSLAVKGDELEGPFIGQHDARLLPDGTLTVYDNHVALGPPRAVRYRIDTAKRTATLLEDVREPLVWSPAEGSARRLPGGNWVVSWGATNLVSELTSQNQKVWRLRLRKAQNYRVQPIPHGRLKPDVLRRAMGVMNPRP